MRKAGNIMSMYESRHYCMVCGSFSTHPLLVERMVSLWHRKDI